jgi:pimeloyl-ACP methyl ester carboxylesterase
VPCSCTDSALTLHTWDSVWETLGDGVAALRYDLRGFGRFACRENAPYNHADDISVVLDATSIEQCDLIGVSMGASIALNFTLDHPEQVRSPRCAHRDIDICAADDENIWGVEFHSATRRLEG